MDGLDQVVEVALLRVDRPGLAVVAEPALELGGLLGVHARLVVPAVEGVGHPDALAVDVGHILPHSLVVGGFLGLEGLHCFALLQPA